MNHVSCLIRTKAINDVNGYEGGKDFSEDWWNALSDKDFTHMKRMKINTVKLKGILDNKVNTPAKVKRTHLISVNDEELEHLCIILYETPLFEKACENWDDESVQLHKDLYNKLQTIINNNR